MKQHNHLMQISFAEPFDANSAFQNKLHFKIYYKYK